MEDLPSSQSRYSQISFVSAVLAVPPKIFSSLLTNDSSDEITGAEGFEPSNTGSKDLCLTTWPHPNVSQSTLPQSPGNTPNAAMVLSPSRGNVCPTRILRESRRRSIEIGRTSQTRCQTRPHDKRPNSTVPL